MFTKVVRDEDFAAWLELTARVNLLVLAFSNVSGKEFIFNRLRAWFSSVRFEEVAVAAHSRSPNYQEYFNRSVFAQYHW